MVGKVMSLMVVVVQEAAGVVLVVAAATPMVTRLLGVATPVVVVQISVTTSVVEQGVTVVTVDVVAVAEELMAILFASTVVKLATLWQSAQLLQGMVDASGITQIRRDAMDARLWGI